jgi:hypothetical protein
MPSSFKELRVWQEAMKFVVSVYRTTNNFPKHELYGLSHQLRRAAVSISSNVAKERDTDHIGNSEIFSCTQEDRYWKCRHN